MNWKSTAIVSGASVLAAWFGVSSEAPAARPAARVSIAAHASRTPVVVPDIQQQAAHLESRLPIAAFSAPSRNPFKFGERKVAARPHVAARSAAATFTPAPALPAPPPFTLAGMAGNDNAGTMQYTAVLSTPAGAVLAKQGDVVQGWSIDAVDEGGVTARAADGRTERLSLPR